MSATTTAQFTGMHAASPMPTVVLPATPQTGDLAKKVLACLASGPKERAEIAGIIDGTSRDVSMAITKLVRAGAAVEIGESRYQVSPGAHETIDTLFRLNRVILAFLGELRQAWEVAGHIRRPVSNATGHLAAMRRRGLVVRVAHGRYERA